MKEKIIEDFKNSELIYLELRQKMDTLIKSLITSNGSNIHQLTSRVKIEKSLNKKINGKIGKYEKLTDITDILGCRIITYFEDDVDKIAKIIENEFIIDWDNSIDKRKIETDRFGYLSLHYVVELNKPRLKLTEYKNFKGIKFEIQIRSILQHSWAEIEHDIGYKGEFSIPDSAKRSFSRIAALLEIADQEFVRLRERLNDYEINIADEIIKSPSSVKIDNASLTSFITSNKGIKNLDNIIAQNLNIDLFFEEESISNLAYKINVSGITTIEELNSFIKNESEQILIFSNFFRSFRKSRDERGKGINGISIFEITSYKVLKYGNSELKIRFFENERFLERNEIIYKKYLDSITE